MKNIIKILIPILFVFSSYSSLYNFKFINEGAIIIKYGHNILESNDIICINLSTIRENKKGINVHIKFWTYNYHFFSFNLSFSLYYLSLFVNKAENVSVADLTLMHNPISIEKIKPDYAMVIAISFEPFYLGLSRIKSGVNFPKDMYPA